MIPSSQWTERLKDAPEGRLLPMFSVTAEDLGTEDSTPILIGPEAILSLAAKAA